MADCRGEPSGRARRSEHQAILAILSAMDGTFLHECACWFAGGTAVSLRCGEPRISRDVDFLCASREGYRRVRERVFETGAEGLFDDPVELVRELRADRYGVRTAVRAGGLVIKVELVSEGRIALSGASDPALPVARLCDEDLVAEKLLANVDRGLDEASMARDVIDLLLLEETLGEWPPEAFEKARGAYGAAVDRALLQVREALRSEPRRLERCFDALDVSPEARLQVAARL